MLLRGAYLRNTKWVLGAVIFTGLDTKIMRNAEPGRNKTSNVEELMNKMIVGILFMQFCCCLISSVISSVWMNQ